jgi:hypothetical protein
MSILQEQENQKRIQSLADDDFGFSDSKINCLKVFIIDLDNCVSNIYLNIIVFYQLMV